MSTTTTREKAAAHEALYLRLEALHRQLVEVAVRHPAGAVAPAVRTLAEQLLYDALNFIPRNDREPQGKTRGLPAAAETHAALAAQLGQALAALSLWEAAHSAWNGEYYVWRMTRGEPEPIRRMRPKITSMVKTPEQKRESKRLREKIMYMIDAKFTDGYHAGYKDALHGIPPEPEKHSVVKRMAALEAEQSAKPPLIRG